MILEKLRTLSSKIKELEDKEDKDFYYDSVIKDLQQFPRYINSVYNMEVQQVMIYNRYEGEELRDKIQNLDTARRMCHDAAIVSCHSINAVCRQVDCDIICPQTEDRYEIAAFIGNFVNEVYLQGIEKCGKTFDEVIENTGKNNLLPLSNVEPEDIGFER